MSAESSRSSHAFVDQPSCSLELDRRLPGDQSFLWSRNRRVIETISLASLPSARKRRHSIPDVVPASEHDRLTRAHDGEEKVYREIKTRSILIRAWRCAISCREEYVINYTRRVC